MVPLSRNGPQCSEFSAGTMSGFSPFSFPLRKQGPRNRGGAAVTEQTSVQWNFRRHDARVLLKEQHAPCRGDRGGSMSSWPPPRAPWSLDPGVRRANEESRKARGPGAAVMPLSGNSPHCSGFSAGTVLELSLKNSTLGAAEAVVARCPFGRHPELRGPWIPAFVEKAMREREGDEGNRCRILKGAGLGAVGCRRRCILAGCSAVRLVEQGQLSGAVVGQADADAHQAHGAAAAQPGLLGQLAVGRQVWTRAGALHGGLAKVVKPKLDELPVHRRPAGPIQSLLETPQQIRQGGQAGLDIGQVPGVGALYRDRLARSVDLHRPLVDALGQLMQAQGMAAELPHPLHQLYRSEERRRRTA